MTVTVTADQPRDSLEQPLTSCDNHAASYHVIIHISTTTEGCILVRHLFAQRNEDRLSWFSDRRLPQ